MSGSTEGYANEPVRGLPGLLPAGEHIVWQGSPEWKRLAQTAFHVRAVILYFGLILGAAFLTGAGATGLALTALAGLGAVGVLGLIAWMSSRSTVYTLTNRRIVLRIGIALPTCINIPLKIIANASVKLHADGTADIPLELKGPDRMGWMLLWPHARPWKLSFPEPMLRAVPDGKAVAALLSRTLLEAVPEGRRQMVLDAAQAERPVGEAQAA
ncbi:MAG: photosynthetic complex putative assembly protein PuhB [Sandaracinobacteroides sp.]